MEMTFSNVLRRTWSLYTQFFARFFLLALVVFAAVNAVFAIASVALDTSSRGQATLAALIGMAASVVGTFWLQGAMVFAVQDVQDGVFDTTTGEVFRRVHPYLGTLIPAGLLAGVAIAAGFFALIVPGLFLLTIWSLIAPSIVVEEKDVMQSFGRSRALVRGHGTTVFSIVLVTTLMTAIAGGLLRFVFSPLPLFLEILLGSTLASAVVAPFSAIALTVTFFTLRDARSEHPSPPSS